MTFAEIKSLIEQRGQVVRDGNDWRGRCPAHSDDGARGDLAFRESDGKIVLHCWAGCQPKSIVEALGLKWSDMFSGNGHKSAHRPQQPKPVYADLAQAVEAIGKRLQAHYVSDWRYTNADGTDAFWVVRFENDKGKHYRPIHPENDTYVEGDPPGLLPLYNLPTILANTTSTIYACEGEKAADAGTSIGLLTTTSAHGAQSPKKTDWRHLAGRDVVILPDRDDAGKKYADTVTNILLRLSSPAKVRMVDLPGLPAGGDLFDYVHDSEAEDNDVIKRNILALAAAAAPVTTPTTITGATTQKTVNELTPSPDYVCMADVEAKPVQWLWRDRIPSAMLSLLIGVEGKGKTFVGLDMAARITTGRPWTDARGPEDCPSVGNVVFLTSEDHLAFTVRPRLDAMKADSSKVFALRGVTYPEGEEFFDVVKHLPALEDMVTQVGNVKMILVDPLTAFLGATDQHKNGEVRTALARFSTLAERHDCAVVGISHLNKDASKTAIHRTIGSVAFSAAARAVWLIGDDKEDDNRRIFCPVKCNLAPMAKSLAFRIKDGAVVWEDGEYQIDANDLLATGPDDTVEGDAIQFITTLLSDGRIRATEVKRLGKQNGLSERTLMRAKRRARIVSEKEGIGSMSVWYWRLPHEQ